MYKKLLVLVAILMVLTGCNKKIELVEPYQITNQIIETMKSKTEQGIYMIENSKNQIILFYGIEKGVKKMSSSITNNVLTILFETEEMSQPQFYTYKVNSSSSFDTIQISIDGKAEAFNTIFVQ
ncbi:MAG: hypothetical protein WBI17_08385 [Clostridiaceae bacterium]